MRTADGQAAKPGVTPVVGSLVLVLVTTAVALLPDLRYAYEAPGLQIALHSADGVIALVVAYMVYGRYRQTSRVRDLLLASSLTVLAVANLPFSALPQALAIQQGDVLAAWVPLFVRTFGAALFAAAAVTPRRVRVDRRTARRAVLFVAGTVAWLGGCGLLAADRLPPPVPLDLVLDASSQAFAGHPIELALQGMGMTLYVSAAWAFSRGGRRDGDDFLHWLAAAAVLAAGARLNYLLFPSLYTEYLYTGDLLRLGFYLMLVVGAAREIRSYWSARLGAAITRGRQDALREVEDTIVPDLREAVRRTEELAAGLGTSGARETADSSREVLVRLEQTLEEVRREAAAIAAEEPFDAKLHDAVAAIALRRRLGFEVRVAPVIDLAQNQEALLSIATEAVRGATRSGGGSRVRVSVSTDPLRLVVHDDGEIASEDTERAAGLERIRRWAAQEGGAVTVTSSAGRGTTVTVDWL